jgi:uncharacterized damage-inducible protein DinB
VAPPGVSRRRKAPSKRAKAARAAGAARRSPAAPPAANAELTRLLDLLDRAWEGPSWHGASVREALDGVTAAAAAARPIAAAHTIGELVLHMAAWKRAVARRLGGTPYSPSDAENFPAFRAGDWTRARAALRREHAALRAAVKRVTPERLPAPAAPGSSLVYLQAHGIIHHDLWHAGQILVLRRAIESAAPRSRR